MCNWIMGEFVRVYHDLTIDQAQKVVDLLANVRIPVVWTDGTTKRVLQPDLKLPEQLLLLIATTLPEVSFEQLLSWSEAPDKASFIRLMRSFQKKRFAELDERTGNIRILPPGSNEAQKIIQRATRI